MMKRDVIPKEILNMLCIQWRTQKISEGGQVSPQLCDVTNQLSDHHSRGVRGHAPGKILQNYP